VAGVREHKVLQNIENTSALPTGSLHVTTLLSDYYKI